MKKHRLHLIALVLTLAFCMQLPASALAASKITLKSGAAAAFAFSVSFCTGTALLVSMLLSSIIGTTVPILFKRLGVDPAVASGPLITTVNDLVAVTAYYGLAWLLLIEILHF